MDEKSITYICWQDEMIWIGHLDEYPDYIIHGESIEKLEEKLLTLYRELKKYRIPLVRHHGWVDLVPEEET